MTPDDLGGQRVVVLGVGIDVAAALPVVVAARPAALTVVDADPARARRALDHAGLEGVDVLGTLDDAPTADVALRSPGYSPYQPAVRARIDAGLATVTPLGLWLTSRGDRPSVAITGTKGKSSTSVLTAAALERLGVPAIVLGNIGVPPWDHPPDTPLTAVLEVSSYQALDLPCTSPVAALTAIGEDHVDWHASVEQYLLDKSRVFTAPTASGSRWSGIPSGVDRPGPFAGIDFTAVPVPSADLRASNARLAAATALVATAGDARQVDELGSELLVDYPDLPGRFSRVADLDGVEYIDDALASNPLGLVAAFHALGDRPVAAIVGGADRGADIEPVLRAIAGRPGITSIVCIDDAIAMVERYAAVAEAATDASDLESAVRTAAAGAVAGSVVLFSPAMPTPAAQGSWVERSSRFRRAVDALD